MSSQPGFNFGYFACKVTHKPLDQPEVRQALDMVINKKVIIDAVYQPMNKSAQDFKISPFS